MTVSYPVRRFPRLGIPPRRRGVRGILSPLTDGSLIGPSSAITGQPWFIPDLYYNLKNQASPDQVYEANQQANAAIVQPETNPVTGQIVPAAQTYAMNTASLPSGALQQGMTQSTGSSIADAFNNLFAGIFGGSQIPSDGTSGIPWGTIALVAALGVGGYFLYKAL